MPRRNRLMRRVLFKCCYESGAVIRVRGKDHSDFGYHFCLDKIDSVLWLSERPITIGIKDNKQACRCIKRIKPTISCTCFPLLFFFSILRSTHHIITTNKHENKRKNKRGDFNNHAPCRSLQLAETSRKEKKTASREAKSRNLEGTFWAQPFSWRPVNQSRVCQRSQVL